MNFINLETINYVKQEPVVQKMAQYTEIVEEERKFKAKLYTYPNWEEGCTVFDDEDLLSESMLILCIKASFDPSQPGSDQHRVYVWRGAEFEEDDEESGEEFVKRSMEAYWGCPTPENQYNIQMQYEYQNKETDEFLDQF